MEALQVENANLRKEVERLKKKTLDNGDQCSICLSKLEPIGRALFQTACGHVFHFQCVKTCILTNQKGCPLCRKSFSDMTPPRTPFRNVKNALPGFMSAREADALYYPEMTAILEQGDPSTPQLNSTFRELNLETPERNDRLEGRTLSFEDSK